MLGSPCSPCCECSAEEMLKTWRRLCASTVTVRLVGTIPATDYAAYTAYATGSTFVPPNTIRHYITNAFVPSGWYKDGDIPGLGAIPKQNPAEFGATLGAGFLDGKPQVNLTEYVLEPDLTTFTNYRQRDFGSAEAAEAAYTTTNVNGSHIVRFAGGSGEMKLLMVVKIGNQTSQPWVIGMSKCAVTAMLYVATYRKYKHEFNAGARIGAEAVIYDLESRTTTNIYRDPYSEFTRVALTSISASPRAIGYGGYVAPYIGPAGPRNPEVPRPGGTRWHDALASNENQPWDIEVETYTSMPISGEAASSRPVPIVFSQVPQQWQPNNESGLLGSTPYLKYVGEFFITTSYTLDVYNAYGTYVGTNTIGDIVLDKDRGYATKANTMYLPVSGNWRAAPRISAAQRWLQAPPPTTSYYGFPILPEKPSSISGAVQDDAKTVAVTESAAIEKPTPLLPDGTPLAVYPEVVQEGTFYPGSTIRIRLRFPSRTDIYAPLVNYQQPNPNGGFFNSSYPTPVLDISVGGLQQSAAYESGSGTDTLVFKYVVPNNVTTSRGVDGERLNNSLNYDLPGVQVISLFWGWEVLHPELSTFLVPIANTFVNPAPVFEVTQGLPVAPATQRNLVTGDVVEWKLTFPREFTVTGAPKTSLRLSTGNSGLRNVSPSAVTGNTMVFSYTIQPNDRSFGVVMGTPLYETNYLWGGTVTYSDGTAAFQSFGRYPLGPGNPVVITVNQ